MSLTCVGTLFAVGPSNVAAQNVEVLTRISDIRSLPREEAAKFRRVKVRAVVTWKGRPGELTVQDESSGIWVNVTEARKHNIWKTDDALLGQLHVGQELEIEGVSDPAGYAPVILPERISVLGIKSLPPLIKMVPSRFFSGADDCQRIQVRGVVQGFQPSERGWLLRLDANPGLFTAEIPLGGGANPESLVDAVVNLRGVTVALFNARGELTIPRVFLRDADDVVIERAAPAPFDAPIVPLDRLMRFQPEPAGPHRVRIIGTVTFALPGQFCFLQQGDNAVRIETRSGLLVQAGDRVEAAGFVDMTRHIGTLVEAHIRKIGIGNVPAAVVITPEEIIASNNVAMDTGQLASPHDFDGHLIRFSARLLSVEAASGPGMPVRRLTLVKNLKTMSAVLQAGDATALDALRLGSELELSGIVQLEFTPLAEPLRSLRPIRISVLLRSAADVTVLQIPSWWTVQRLFNLVAAVGIILGAALLWIRELHRQVRLKTQQLAVEIHSRRDAAIEFQATLRERNRLAANLHDTLLQTMGGIAFQMGACAREIGFLERSSKATALLAVAKRMVDHAVKELRGSVWELRGRPLQGRALPDALREIAERMRAEHKIEIEVQTEGSFDQIPDFVAGNLLFAAREALHNAVMHGRPGKIALKVLRSNTDPGWVEVVVRDDGVGFRPGDEAGANQGHFGLTGMRERIDQLDGMFILESAPGKGTEIQMKVPIRSYDEIVS